MAEPDDDHLTRYDADFREKPSVGFGPGATFDHDHDFPVTCDNGRRVFYAPKEKGVFRAWNYRLASFDGKGSGKRPASEDYVAADARCQQLRKSDPEGRWYLTQNAEGYLVVSPRA